MMTDKQKQAINVLRNEGYGYGTIARMLGMNKETVKSYCRRNGVKNTYGIPDDLIRPCRNCGKFVVQNPKRKKKLYCSDECRQIWWKEHPEMIKRKAFYNIVCLECGKAFQVYGNANRKYCSHECYVKHRIEMALRNV